ncbi:MAG TPA: Uma2 family endonuclease [Thermoanaerobaculia bacterium]|nr:Uma2 family endonuclease [Thermoanaerobaculia bacterium]
MAEPVTTVPARGDSQPAADLADSTLLRWVERPDGRLELRETPLTPEDYLDPQEGDTWVQGERHNAIRGLLASTLRLHFVADPEVLVTEDLKFLLGAGLSRPAPDVAVVRGVRRGDRDVFDVVGEGVAPCLVIEVVSPKSARIRRVDVERKVRDYCDAGVPEYVIVDRPSRKKDSPFELLGYRLDSRGRYRRIEPDGEGRLLSETIGVWFGLSADRLQVLLWDAATGERMLSPEEVAAALVAAEERAAREAEARKAEVRAREAAEERAARETEARKAAESEIARLRAELERLSKQ